MLSKRGQSLTPTKTNRTCQTPKKKKNQTKMPQVITILCGAALTTTCVMLSGSVSMVSPPPRTALLILWALLGRLSPPVDSSCSCGITLYQLSVQSNEYQVSMLSCSLRDVMLYRASLSRDVF